MTDRRASFVATAISVAVLVAAQTYFTHAAAAEKYNTVPLKTMSPDDLKKKCGESGGTFENLGTDWSCQTKKGVVACNERQCTGVTTAKSSPAPKQLRDPATVLETLSEE